MIEHNRSESENRRGQLLNTMHIIKQHRCRVRSTLDVQGIVVGVIVGLVLLWGIAPWMI